MTKKCGHSCLGACEVAQSLQARLVGLHGFYDQDWVKLESLKVKKRKFEMEVQNAEADIKAQKLVSRVCLEKAAL